MFILPNKKAFEVVMHFLFAKLNPVMAVDKFRYGFEVRGGGELLFHSCC